MLRLEAAFAVTEPDRAVDIPSPRHIARIDGAGDRIDIAASRNFVRIEVAPRIAGGEASEKRRSEPAVDPSGDAGDLVVEPVQIAARIEASGSAEAGQPLPHRHFMGVDVGAAEPDLVMHRVEEHARGLGSTVGMSA